MALQQKITTNSEVTIENSYIRIDTISGDKNGITMRIGCYVSAEKCELGIAPFCEFIYGFKPILGSNAANFIKQGYEYLKTLDEFKNATDC